MNPAVRPWTAAAALSVVLLSACASTSGSIVTTDQEEIDPEDIMEIEVVVQKCAIPDLKTFFDFDSDEIETSENLDVLARCLNGPLSTSRVLLVGRTDRVGSRHYNAKLGLARARKVGAYLIGKNVDQKRIKYQSSGEARASRKQTSNALDRRVDIHIIL